MSEQKCRSNSNRRGLTARLHSMLLIGVLGVILWPGATGGTAQAAFPGQNGRIFYHCGTFSSPSICSIDPQGGVPQVEIPGGVHPAISPNGKKMAFATSINGFGDVHAGDVGGGSTYLGPGQHPTWSPDGSRIAYICYQSFGGGQYSYNICTIKPDGTGQTQLTNFPSNGIRAHGVSWGPTNRLAFYGGVTGSNDVHIYTINDQGGDLQSLINGDVGQVGFYPYLSWSPDGSKIAFNGDEQTTTVCNGNTIYLTRSNIYVIPATGGARTPLTNQPFRDHPCTWGTGDVDKADADPAWSPDGTQITYNHYESVYNGPTTSQIWMMQADGSSQHAVGGSVSTTRQGGTDWAVGSNVLSADFSVPEKADLNQSFTVSLNATNNGTTGLTNVMPVGPLTFSGTSTVQLVSGPSPPAVANLAASASTSFNYTYKGTTPGKVKFQGAVKGTASGGPETSPNVESSEVSITGPLTVNSTGDAPDSNVNDQICDTGATVGSDAECTLRAAIMEAEQRAGTDDIKFNIPGGGTPIIQLTSGLPTITQPVRILGDTQPGGKAGLQSGGSAIEGLTITSGNSTVKGMVVQGFTQSGIGMSIAGNNTITGNFIGTDVTGNGAAGNPGYGIEIRNGSSDNTIGGSTAADRNIVSGNGIGGVHITSGNNNRILGNYIGTNVNGTMAIGNGLQNGGGIVIEGSSSNNTIGGTNSSGTCSGPCNLISGNYNTGVNITGDAVDTTIQGNFVGTAVGGTSALSNLGYGINVDTSGGQTHIGGVSGGQRNIIAFNQLTGVRVGRGLLQSGTGNDIRGNSIHSNGYGASNPNNGLGIDLADQGNLGVTLNDRPVGQIPDTDPGPNDLQNFPDLASGGKNGANLIVYGDLYSTPNSNFTLDFYSVSACDPLDHGEGERYLGSTQKATDVNGHATLQETIAGEAGVSLVTATATDTNASTSEFSRCVAVGDADLFVGIDDSPPVVAVGNNISYDIAVGNNGPDPATGVTVIFTLAPKTSFVLSQPSGCTAQAQVVTCDMGSLGVNLQKSVNIQTKVSSDPGDVFYFLDTGNRVVTANVEVHADQHEPATGNNNANETTQVGTVGMGPGVNPPPNGSAQPGSGNNPVTQANLSGPPAGSPLVASVPAGAAVGDTTFTSVELTAGGTGNDATNITAIKVYQDANSDGAVDGGDTLLANGAYGADNGTVTLNLSPPLQVAVGQTKTLLVTYDFPATMAAGPRESAPNGHSVPLSFIAIIGLGILGLRRANHLALGLVLVGCLLVLSGCGGGGGSPSFTYTASITALTGTEDTTGNPVTVAGLPIPGATLTVTK